MPSQTVFAAGSRDSRNVETFSGTPRHSRSSSRGAVAAVIAACVGASSPLLAPPLAEAVPVPAIRKVSTPRVISKIPMVRTVSVGSNPFDIAISDDLAKAFVVTDGGVSVVSLLTHRELTEFGTGGFHGQNGITLVRGGTQGYITNYDTPFVVAFDTETYKVLRRIPVGGTSSAVVTSNTPRGQRAYVALPQKQQLVAIDTRTATIVQRIDLPDVEGLAADPDGRTVWAGSADEDRAWVIDTSSGRIVRTVRTDHSGPVNAIAIAIAPGGAHVWLTGPGGVSVVDSISGKLQKFIQAPDLFPGLSNPQEVAFSGSGRYAFVTNATFPDAPSRGQLAAIDTTTYRLAWRASTGVGSFGLGVDNQRRTVFVSNFNDDTVSYLPVPR